MMRITLMVFISFYVLALTSAQSADIINKREAVFDSTTLNKQAFYLSLGGGAQSLIYELNFANTVRSAWHIKIGTGFNQAIFAANSQHILAGVTYLTGRKRKNHLEINTGGIFMFDHQDYKSDQNYKIEGQGIIDYLHLNLAAYLGYRYQKPGGHLIFRYGIGYPEITAISFGYAF